MSGSMGGSLATRHLLAATVDEARFKFEDARAWHGQGFGEDERSIMFHREETTNANPFA